MGLESLRFAETARWIVEILIRNSYYVWRVEDGIVDGRLLGASLLRSMEEMKVWVKNIAADCFIS